MVFWEGTEQSLSRNGTSCGPLGPFQTTPSFKSLSSLLSLPCFLPLLSFYCKSGSEVKEPLDTTSLGWPQVAITGI